MKLKVGEVLSVINGNPQNVLFDDLDTYFDWLHFIETSSIKRPIESKKVCYFAVYEPDPDINGWYNQGFDNRKKISELFLKNPEWVFVVEVDQPDISELIENGCKIVIVRNIRDSIKKIFDMVLFKVRSVVIGVTGSVGKTTCVALLEDVLNCYAKVLRIYSKRLSPLSIMTSVVNLLEEDHKFIVTEYCLYRPHHIEELALLLRPQIAAFLNVGSSHLGVNGINTVSDIFESKIKLLDAADTRIMSSDLVGYGYSNKVCLFGIDDSSSVLFKTSSKKFYLNDIGYSIKLPILTKLSVKQVLATLSILNGLGLEINKQSLLSIENFKPKENRLLVKNFKKAKLIFDGEMSNVSRLIALGENYYDKSILVITQQNHGDEPLEPQKEGFRQLRSLFNRIYVIESIESDWLEYFKEDLMPDCLVDEVGINDLFQEGAVVFVHAGGFFRFGQKIQLPFSI
ncbi:MAG: hypothetical protein KBB86_01985 [Candidatus Pacebacteria bacterium]|nr:hypothetical protein [Candidatus Paceibacterota bacterium]